MFQERHYCLTRARLATLLGVQIAEEPHYLHYQAYANTVPPRRPHETHFPSDEEVSVLFQQPFLPGTPRTPDRLTPVAHTIHLALRKSLLFRIGYNEGITALQQWLLLYILTGRDFDLVDFFICELEDVIMDGMTVHHRHPFAHWICWILAQLSQNVHMDELALSRTHFAVYSPTTPRDGHRGPRGQRRAQQVLDERALAEGRVADDPTAAEDASLAAAEAQLPHYLVTDSEDSEDDEDYIPTVTIPRGAHDDEAGSSGAARVPAPPVTAAQVTQPDSLATILQRLSDQQDRFAAAQLSMQAEQARQQEAQTLVLEGIQQQQEAMRLQLQQQSQIQQQMFTFFLGCFGQL